MPEQSTVQMSGGGFLHNDVETRLCERYMTPGARWILTTNCKGILEAARRTFPRDNFAETSVDVSLRIWVDEDDSAQPPWPKPYARGIGDLVFAGFDTRSSLLANLRTRRVIGRFSRGMASDSSYWKTVIFPMLFSIVAGSLGFAEMHASCVASGPQGLILLGPSRCGKSTLAMALTRVGFKFLSDDRTFCSLKQGKLVAWAPPRPLKLRPDAACWFDDLRDREPTDVQNGERVFHFDPGPERTAQCVPQMLVFLERDLPAGFVRTAMPRTRARSCIERDLLAESPEAVQRQEEILDHLLSLPRFTVRYGGSPQEVADQLAALFFNETRCR